MKKQILSGISTLAFLFVTSAWANPIAVQDDQFFDFDEQQLLSNFNGGNEMSQAFQGRPNKMGPCKMVGASDEQRGQLHQAFVSFKQAKTQAKTELMAAMKAYRSVFMNEESTIEDAQAAATVLQTKKSAMMTLVFNLKHTVLYNILSAEQRKMGAKCMMRMMKKHRHHKFAQMCRKIMRRRGGHHNGGHQGGGHHNGGHQGGGHHNGGHQGGGHQGGGHQGGGHQGGGHHNGGHHNGGHHNGGHQGGGHPADTTSPVDSSDAE